MILFILVSFEFYIHWHIEVPSDNYLQLNLIGSFFLPFIGTTKSFRNSKSVSLEAYQWVHIAF